MYSFKEKILLLRGDPEGPPKVVYLSAMKFYVAVKLTFLSAEILVY